MPRATDAWAVLRERDVLSPRLPAQVKRAVDTESARGLVRAARVQAASFVAQTAMGNLELLSSMESAAAAKDPITASRYTGLVDDFLMVARHELRKLARDL